MCKWVVLASLVTLSSGCAHETSEQGIPRPCDLDEQTTRFAGSGSKDCGHATPTDTASVNACIKGALASGSPFHARYDYPGFDSFPARVVLRTEDGRFDSLAWDSDPSGGNAVGAHLERVSCSGLVSAVDGSGVERYDCIDRTPTRKAICDQGTTL